MILFKKVNKWYGELHVLNNINLEVAKGEVVVVCGPSGSGKSTLIRCINRLEPIQKGELVVDDMEVHDKKTNMTKIRAEIGFVFQSFNLYPHMTALQNTTIAPIKVRKMKKEKAEKQAPILIEAQEILVASGAVGYCAYHLVERYRRARNLLEQMDLADPSPLLEILDSYGDQLVDLLSLSEQEIDRSMFL